MVWLKCLPPLERQFGHATSLRCMQRFDWMEASTAQRLVLQECFLRFIQSNMFVYILCFFCICVEHLKPGQILKGKSGAKKCKRSPLKRNSRTNDPVEFLEWAVACVFEMEVVLALLSWALARKFDDHDHSQPVLFCLLQKKDFNHKRTTALFIDNSFTNWLTHSSLAHAFTQ